MHRYTSSPLYVRWLRQLGDDRELSYIGVLFLETLSAIKHHRRNSAVAYLRALGRGIVIKVRAQITNESHVHCSVCEWKGVRFYPFVSSGLHPRSDAYCPVCGSLERQRTMVNWLRQKGVLKDSPCNLLYVAPQQGPLALFSQFSNWHCFTIDLESSLADIQMNLEQLAFPDETFDLTVCSHVLEHVKDDLKAMSELRRVLRVKGIALLPTPINQNLKKTVEFTAPDPSQSNHRRQYGRDFFDRLRMVGFELVPGGESVMAVQKSTICS